MEENQVMERAFNRGLLAGILLVLGGRALRWLLEPAHQDASTRRVAVVAGQAAAALAGSAWLIASRRQRASDEA
jgi:hypothetical protein